jgi:hypothetical protein
VSAGEPVVALAESQLVGGECFDDIERVRADRAGGPLASRVSVVRAARASRFAADRVFLVKPFEKPLEGHRDVG